MMHSSSFKKTFQLNQVLRIDAGGAKRIADPSACCCSDGDGVKCSDWRARDKDDRQQFIIAAMRIIPSNHPLVERGCAYTFMRRRFFFEERRGRLT